MKSGAAASGGRHRSRRESALIMVGLVVATLAVYWQVRLFDFINLDDPLYVTSNPYVQGGISWEGVVWALGSGHATNWHPVTWLSHMLDCQMFGLGPGWHHLTNLGLHLANTLLLLGVVRRLTGALWRSAMVAGLFALHPLHVESVAWVAERKDVLSGLFFLLTLWAYARFTEFKVQGSRFKVRSVRWYGFALAFFALGLMSKPMLVTVPFVLLLLDYWPLQRFALKTQDPRPKTLLPLLWEKLPFFLLSVASCAVTLWAQASGGALSAVSLPLRLGNAALSYVGYAGKMLWPAGLAVFYPFPKVLAVWQVAGAVLILVILTLCAVAARRGRPYWTVGWLWYLGMLVPVIGLVQVGGQAMADRYTYLPLIGLFVGMVWTVADVAEAGPLRRLAVVAAVCVLAACGWLTHKQAAYWRNSLRLYRHALAVAPPSALIHDNLGSALFNRGELAEAKSHFEAAVRLKPNNAMSHSNLGIIAGQAGNLDEAIRHFAEAVKYAPNHPVAHKNWGVALLLQGRTNEALAHLTISLRADPFSADTRTVTAQLLAGQGRLDDATWHFQAALRSRPNSPAAHCQLAGVLVRRQQVDEAIWHYRQALRLKPDGPEPLSRLAWLLATHPDAKHRDGAEAVRLASRAVELARHHDAETLDTLAAALAEAGRFPEAVQTAQAAAAEAATAAQTNLASRISARLNLYQARAPYRESPP